MRDQNRQSQKPIELTAEFTMPSVKRILGAICNLDDATVFGLLRETAMAQNVFENPDDHYLLDQGLSPGNCRSFAPPWVDTHAAIGSVGVLHSAAFWKKLIGAVTESNDNVEAYAEAISQNNHRFLGRFNSYLLLRCLMGRDWIETVLDAAATTSQVEHLYNATVDTPAQNFEEFLANWQEQFRSLAGSPSDAQSELTEAGAFQRRNEKTNRIHHCPGVAVTQKIYNAYSRLLDDAGYTARLKLNITAAGGYYQHSW